MQCIYLALLSNPNTYISVEHTDTLNLDICKHTYKERAHFQISKSVATNGRGTLTDNVRRSHR